MKFLFSLLLSFMLFACNGGGDQSAADLTMPVVVEKVKRGPIAEYISATGTLRAIKEESVIAEVRGMLHLAKSNGTLLASGARVEADHLLAEVDNAEYLLEVRVESQRLAMENAEREFEKQQALFKEGGVTEKELEVARKNALDARLNYDSAELKAEKLQLRAPISGFITNLQSNFDGMQIAAGFQLCKIMDYAKTTVQVNLPNSDLGQVRVGQKVKVTNYALEGETFIGEVVAIDPTIDAQTRTFAASVQIDNQNLRLRPGMFVKTDIVVKEHPDAILIPKVALQTREGQQIVFVVKGVSAELREVVTGIETKEDVEILEGLAENERLVVKGHETLRDKSKVRV
ncbi:MAG: efflux RND transporter periplasmic adaptor subunit, partial [bacterium]